MLWLKAFHIIFVVCWFAGLFYLPRILVYHAASDSETVREQLAVMARRLYRFVTPFMYITLALGLVLIAHNYEYYLSSAWMYLKLAGVAFLVFTIYCAGAMFGQQSKIAFPTATFFSAFLTRYRFCFSSP